MCEIILTFGKGSDEYDVGLGYIYSFIAVNIKTKKTTWDILWNEIGEFQPPKSDKLQDVIEFILHNYNKFYQSDKEIDLMLNILKGTIIDDEN